MNYKWFCLIICLLCLDGNKIWAQKPQQQNRVDKNGVIEIEAQILDSRVELPQVQILDKRKKPDFDEVKVEKSFKSELMGKNESLKFTPITSGKIKRIKNIEVLLNKKRF